LTAEKMEEELKFNNTGRE